MFRYAEPLEANPPRWSESAPPSKYLAGMQLDTPFWGGCKFETACGQEGQERAKAEAQDEGLRLAFPRSRTAGEHRKHIGHHRLFRRTGGNN